MEDANRSHGEDGQEEHGTEGMKASAPGTNQGDLAATIRQFGLEPDTEHYLYDPNSCSNCGQLVLIVQSRERQSGYRSERTACEYCYARLAKRTKAKIFRWVFLQGWRPHE